VAIGHHGSYAYGCMMYLSTWLLVALAFCDFLRVDNDVSYTQKVAPRADTHLKFKNLAVWIPFL